MTAIERDADGNVFYGAHMTTEDTLNFYKRYAETYDHSTHGRNYKGPSLAADEVRTYFRTQRDVKILDCGAGTGLVGEELYRHGFTQMDAVDPSKEMLDLLEKKHIYQNVICDFLGKNPLPIENDCYDCVTMVGAIMAGAASETCFPELIRVVKSGGIIVIATREVNIKTDPHLKEHLEPEMQHLHDNGSWQWLKREIIPNYVSTLNGFLAVFRVL